MKRIVGCLSICFGLMGCGGSSGVGSLSSLNQIPETSQMVATSGTSSSILFRSNVSGTPPELGSLTASNAATYFWKAGILDAINDNSATNNQCNEFWGAEQTDGASGGFGACFMAQNVARSFAEATAPAICYMKNMPTQTNLDAGGVILVDGSFEDNDPSNLFNTPSGDSDRIVKVQLRDEPGCPECDQDIYLVVKSAASNAANDMQYAVDLWFCAEGATSGNPSQKEAIRVTKAGLLTYSGSRDGTGDQGDNIRSLSAYLKESSGAISFDSSKERSLISQDSDSNRSSKVNVVISPDDQILLKSFDVESQDNRTRKAYSISNFTATDVFKVSFLEGAFKESETSDYGTYGREGGIEFRDSVYVNAPSNSLISSLASVDFSTDSFYLEAPTIDLAGAFDGFTCGTTASVTITMDQSNTTVQTSTADCNSQSLNGDFCWSDGSDQQIAASEWHTTCTD